jgi:hypothetical protein
MGNSFKLSWFISVPNGNTAVCPRNVQDIIIIILFLVEWDWVSWYCGHYWPIVRAPDDRWWWLWRNWCNKNWLRTPKYSEKTYPSATLSTINPTWLDPGSNPGRRGGKPATNRLRYGSAHQNAKRWIIFHARIHSLAFWPELISLMTYLGSSYWFSIWTSFSQEMYSTCVSVWEELCRIINTVVPRYTSLIRSRSLDLYQTGRIPNRTYTERIFPIRYKGKEIIPFPWKTILLLLAYYIVHWWGCIT